MFDWINLGVASAGVALSLWVFFDSRRNRRRLNAVEVRRFIDEAWDLMGGEEGTSSLEFTAPQEPRRLELANRRLDAALELSPEDSRAHEALRLEADHANALALLGDVLAVQGRSKRVRQPVDMLCVSTPDPCSQG